VSWEFNIALSPSVSEGDSDVQNQLFTVLESWQSVVSVEVALVEFNCDLILILEEASCRAKEFRCSLSAGTDGYTSAWQHMSHRWLKEPQIKAKIIRHWQCMENTMRECRHHDSSEHTGPSLQYSSSRLSLFDLYCSIVLIENVTPVQIFEDIQVH